MGNNTDTSKDIPYATHLPQPYKKRHILGWVLGVSGFILIAAIVSFLVFFIKEVTIPMAVHYGNPFVVRTHLALQKLAGNSTASPEGLLRAIEKGDSEMVELMLKNGADGHDKNYEKSSSLYKILGIDYIYDYSSDKKSNVSALDIAEIQGLEHITSVLLRYGADGNVHEQDQWGYTPLAYAAEQGFLARSRRLLKKGANVDSRTHEQKTPLFLAAERGHTQICKLLLEHDAYINARDIDGQTPLIIACRNDHENVVRLLLRHGANVYLRNNDGKNVFEQSYTPNIVSLLKQYGSR